MDQEKVESLATAGVNVSLSEMIGINILGFLKNPNIKKINSKKYGGLNYLTTL